MREAMTARPPISPLEMPTQVLTRRPVSRQKSQNTSCWFARLVTFGGSLALTLAASYQMYLIIPLNEAQMASAAIAPWLGALMWLLFGLFTLTFGWVALTATATVAGLFSGQGRLRAESTAELQGKTVLLMPIYNEDADAACAALGAMAEDLSKIGQHKNFDIFIISDTNNPDIVAAEMAAVQRLREHLSVTMAVWYRRREQNTNRKAGNIREFITRWGSAYDYMVVLDADSLLAGETLATLVREMDADPSSGIVQTLPRLFGGETLFARLQQFSGAAYGYVFARGLSAWQGYDGNYWGHNAIIRIRAFAESAGLPELSGPRPFGGEIRSHDFVEAALIRRAGWTVRMLPELAGSWEECPPTLLDAAIRDRRWAQGNVQHLAVVSARGLRWPNRAHMLMGVMNYLTSVLWLAMIAVGLVLSTQFATQQLQVFAGVVPPMFDSERMIGLFICTMVLLLLPKILGVLGGLFSLRLRGGSSRLKFILSALLELVFSILYAPTFMLIHSKHLWEIATRRDSGWSAQQRRGSGRTWHQLLASHGVHTLIGILVLVFLFWVSSSLFYWMLPMVIGLLLAIPLSALSGSKTAGCWLEQKGLLGIAEELSPPDIIKRRQTYQDV